MTEEDQHYNEDHGATLASWKIPEFEKHERSMLWYIVAGFIAAALLTWALLSQNFLFAVIILLVGVIVIRQSRQIPHRLTVDLTEDGIRISDHHFYRYSDLRNFWMHYEPPVKKLFVGFKNPVKPDLILPLENQNPIGIRNILSKYLPEDFSREDEPFSEALGRTLKI